LTADSESKGMELCVFVVFSGDQDITFDEAVRVLQEELHYPEDKALQFVRRFDRNNDGHLSSLEFNAMRRKITET